MEVETLKKQESDEVRKIEKWFATRANSFVGRAAQGIFSKKINADDIRMEFRRIGRELEFKDRRLLEMWFENRAEVFISKASKGWGNVSIDIEDVKAEFGIIAREYVQMVYGIDAGLSKVPSQLKSQAE